MSMLKTALSFIISMWTTSLNLLWVRADKAQDSKEQTEIKIFYAQRFIIYVKLGAANPT